MTGIDPQYSTLVLGGIRSGKSAFAEALAERSGLRPVYVATAQAFDDGMKKRIGEHQARRDASWQLIEAPIELAKAIERAASPEHFLLVDCLSLWVTNLMLDGRDIDGAVDALIASVEGKNICLVSNEVGLGGVPMNAMARQFADHCGRLHQRIAQGVDRVIFVSAGLPLYLKGGSG